MAFPMRWVVLLLLSSARSAAGMSTAMPFHGRRDEITPPPGTCDNWVTTALGANVTEGSRWDYAIPDFSNGTSMRAAVHTCSTAAQRSVLVGPFTSKSGGTYDIITYDIIDSLFSAGDRITSFTAMPITTSGEPVGYPPLYVHHIHVGRLTHFYDEHWFTTHGDFSVGSDTGIGAVSTKGYTTYLPHGYCFAVDCHWGLPFAVQAILQDMRSTASAPHISIFVQVSFSLALKDAAIEPATLVWNEAPHGPFGYARFAVLGEPTMSWWTMKWPVSGRLLPGARLHSHYARHHRLFLVDRAPQQLAFFDSHVKQVVYVHDSIPPTSDHETMLLANMSHTEQTLAQLPSVICHDDEKAPSFIVAATDGHPNASRWARYRDFVCRPHTLDRGRISTFVQLFQAVADPDVRLYPMHTDTWFYMHIPGAASSSDIKTVSYRYATSRTTSFAEPIQDEASGSCAERPSPAAVAAYVANSAASLKQAISNHDTADAVASRAANMGVRSENGRSIHISSVVISGSIGVTLLGLLRAVHGHGRALL